MVNIPVLCSWGDFTVFLHNQGRQGLCCERFVPRNIPPVQGFICLNSTVYTKDASKLKYFKENNAKIFGRILKGHLNAFEHFDFSKTLAFRWTCFSKTSSKWVWEKVFDLFFKNDAPLFWFASILLSKLVLSRAVRIADILPSPFYRLKKKVICH